MTYLQVEPLYVIRIEEVIWGAIMMAVTMTIHGFGMLFVLRVNHRLKTRLEAMNNLVAGLTPVILASCMIMVVHLVEVFIWAKFLIWKGAFPNNSLAFYFSLNAYTTLGSNITLPRNWRLLEGLMATTGLLAFAWSTGVIFSLAQKFQDQQVKMFAERGKKGVKLANTLQDNSEDPNLR
jgi:hypothetical protein